MTGRPSAGSDARMGELQKTRSRSITVIFKGAIGSPLLVHLPAADW